MLEQNKPKVLFIDDEVDNLEALERLLRKKYEVLTTHDPHQAFIILDNHPDISIIISDQRMPLMTGVEFLEKSINTHPEAIRILLTGYTDIESVIEAINKGQIYKYITKPWDPVDLQKTLDNALEKFVLKKELKIKTIELEKALINVQSLDQTKSQFMILINHELKTPLTTIMSFSSLLKETEQTEEQKLFTDRIIKSSDKLKNIIDDVLLVVKGELNQIQIRYESISIDSLIKGVHQDIQNYINTKNQNLRVHLEHDTLYGDLGYIKILFFRALHNATKFGLAQSDITINSYLVDNKITIDIENKGPKISQNILEKIIKPFTLDENVMNHSVGMGLGLTICSTIMKAHHGQLAINNTEDGVKVRFVFPNIRK